MNIEADRLLIAPELVSTDRQSLVKITTQRMNGGTESIRVGRHFQML